MKVIGIDGGATKVSGGVVEKINANSFKLISPAVDIKYAEHPNFNADFSPLSLDSQFEKETSSIEKQQGSVYIECVLDIIRSLTESKSFRVAIAMPGIKTNDERGIAAMANGPRIPNFCDQIGKALNLEHSIQRLESDADMCSWGEEYAENGALRNVDNAYYLGGGTGTADGLKLNGELIPFDDGSNWIAKSFELKMFDGHSLEKYASMGGINQLRGSISDSKIGNVLGRLLFERISTIHSGWNNQFQVGRDLQTDHPYINTLLDRIIIGQRLSQFLQSIDGHAIYQALINELGHQCSNAADAISDHYLINSKFNKEYIFMSNLRAAPIIGLGAKVWMTQC